MKNCAFFHPVFFSDLRAFPFDTQRCHIIIESYSYNSQEVSLHWMQDAAVTILRKPELPDFTLLEWKAERIQVRFLHVLRFLFFFAKNLFQILARVPERPLG